MKGFDAYSPANDPTAAIATGLGYQFQGCYYGTGGKVLQPRHLPVFAKHNLYLFMFFERNALRALQGASAGVEDSSLALEQAAAVKQPAGTAITFTVDTDVNMDDRTSSAAVTAYFEALHGSPNYRFGVQSKYMIGVYGSGQVCDRISRAGLAAITVEAGAGGWRGSKEFTGATMQQHPVMLTPNQLGVEYDPLDTQLSLEEIGAWLPGEVAVPIMAPTIPTRMSPVIADFIRSLRSAEQFFIDHKLYNGPIDSDPGPGVRAALRSYLASLK